MIITRFHNMVQLRLTVEFLTPTFLGGADQNAELRAAPFKNLLRQWWRVAKGSKCATYQEMLQQEGKLFGSVLDDSQASASQVRLVLTPDEKFQPAYDALEFGTIHHPEVNNNLISSALYLGYGPIRYNHGHNTFRQYIAPGNKATLTLTFSKTHEATLRDILTYIDAFGTIGSRCRNGWGSLAISGTRFQRQAPAAFTANGIDNIFAGDKKYPGTLGRDNKGLLCWESGTFTDWKAAMQALAATYMHLRTAINIAPQGLQQRHIMGYPVTNHWLRDDNWGYKKGRMPSQLRLMVKRNANNELIARILHLPHKLPKPWPLNKQSLGTELEVWQNIHNRLDNDKTFHRCGGAQ